MGHVAKSGILSTYFGVTIIDDVHHHTLRLTWIQQNKDTLCGAKEFLCFVCSDINAVESGDNATAFVSSFNQKLKYVAKISPLL